MNWSDDPELQQMFVDEVSERSARLVEGGRALRAGTLTSQEAGDLLREGHTIKGTGRVMGYEDVASAGLMLEMLWRWIQHGDIEPAPIFGRVLEGLGAAIPGALEDPTDLIEAMSAVHEFFAEQALPEELPLPPSVRSEPSPEVSESPVAEAAQPPTEPLEPTKLDVAGTAAAAGPEDQGALSSQEAFAEMRRSMNDDSTDPGAGAPTQLGGIVGDVVTFGQPSPTAESPETPASRDQRVSPAPPVEGASGSVIEFPNSDESAQVAPPQPPPKRDDHPSADHGDVVVLPSKRRRTPSESEAGDLGGLIGAVQSWAAEEAISVNAGRLYGLVDHIVSLRMDVEAVRDQLVELAQVAAADPFFAERITEISEGIHPILQASEGIESRALGLAAEPLRHVTNTLPQLGRYLSRKTGKELRVELIGDDVLVDRKVLELLGDAIRQLVVNAAVHGIEDMDTRLGAGKPGTGTIRIEANQADVNLEVTVSDDGRGIQWQSVADKGSTLGLLDADAELSPEALRSLLYRSGFSTRDAEDELAGDGEGLAIVRDAVDAVNGSMTLQSTPGERTAVTLVVPTHQAMQKALLVEEGGIVWGIPETAVCDIVEMRSAVIAVTDHETVLERTDGNVPFASFGNLMGLASDGVPAFVVVVESAVGQVALGVENVVGTRRVAAKEIGPVLADADAITGAALLGGDEVVLLVDTTKLAERQHEAVSEGPAFAPAKVLIVDDSRGVQQVVSSALATSGFSTSVAASVAEALGALHSGSFDGLVVDFSMPRADGVALAHMVRQRHGDLPIVMLSGVAEGEDIDRAREAGVDAFFGKDDFREGGLAEKLRELISARRARERTA